MTEKPIHKRGTLCVSNRVLDYSHGSGQVWPVGQEFRIEKAHETSNGLRYSANAITLHGLVYVWPIPPEALEVSK